MAQSTTAALDAAHGRVVLTVAYTAGDLTPAVVVQRSADGGMTWVNVRGDRADGLVDMLSGDTRLFPDYELPLDVPVVYRSIKAGLDGTIVGSTFNLSATVTLASTTGACLWWVHPIKSPTLIGSYVPSDDLGARLAAPRGVFYPASDPLTAAGRGTLITPIVTYARRRRRAGKAAFCVRSNAESARLLLSLGEPDTICVRSPASHGWGVRYVSVADIDEGHPSPIQAGAWLYTANYVELARPSGTTDLVYQIGASYDDLANAFATYGALAAAYGTYNDQAVALI